MTVEDLVPDSESVEVTKNYLKALETRLRLLEDKEALAALMNRYCRSSDAKDWKTWSLCFTGDAAFDFGPFGTHYGREAIRTVCEAAEGTYT